ncbi:probable chitinase 10 isoform X2 [Neocloeon triangulifer]|uniref:probable chitinase 10 isoform X2 n=1 Tax=Neocloeon triangulifer TaxID=2078957 RepID=UPI00286ED84A|nr:probable chitinase 10 isoform X2 [Neocloeon triangulifer]
MFHKILLGFALLSPFCDAICWRNTSSEQIRRLNENSVKYCIANCLGLTSLKTNKTKSCQFDSSSGRVQGCERNYSFMQGKSKFKVFCNMETEWNFSLTTDTPQTSLCDVIVINIAVFNSSTNEMNAVPNRIAGATSQIKLAKKLGVKVLFKVGSWDEFIMHPRAITKLASDNNAQTAKFIKSITTLINQFDLDGVFFSWIWPGCPQATCVNDIERKKIPEFIQSLARPLKDNGQLFVYFIHGSNAKVALTPGDYFTDIVDVVDYFAFESPTQSGEWSPNADLNFNLKKSKEVLSEYFAKIKSPRFKSKIVMYMESSFPNFELSGAPIKLGGPQLINSKIKRRLEITDWCKRVRDISYDVFRNPETQNYAVKGNTLFAFDDVESMKAKSFGSGVYITEVQYDDQAGECGCGKMPFLKMVVNMLTMNCDPSPCF